jgi:hypothetical protein
MGKIQEEIYEMICYDLTGRPAHELGDNNTPDISPGWTEHEYAEGSGHGAPSPMDLRGSDVEC